MIGGNSGPFSFDRAAAERLAVQASALARARGGSLAGLDECADASAGDRRLHADRLVPGPRLPLVGRGDG